jgi:hypothetical protein
MTSWSLFRKKEDELPTVVKNSCLTYIAGLVVDFSWLNYVDCLTELFIDQQDMAKFKKRLGLSTVLGLTKKIP